jgi:hypothetical protein
MKCKTKVVMTAQSTRSELFAKKTKLQLPNQHAPNCLLSVQSTLSKITGRFL